MVIQSEPTQTQLILAALDLETQFFLCLCKSSQSSRLDSEFDEPSF